ncbi:serine hydrolase domain-containing protein [Winogradskyella sp. PG-2]|uniref:serine hydrolase domain-containing protein n=1 Tax=Winogradskyella sp. PG-2 TaxID=754409 RepID=UPI000458756A|nr:serine hydrolase domain-containing protein [Winogradskyella sp. PG-2]BAO76406.1 beta-lactamase class C and other penicillin binding proteins [Winogradskyella sp. PG-2]
MKDSIKNLILLILISSFSFGQEISQKIDSLVKNNYLNNPEVGISIGFIKNNEEYYTSYGNLDKESQIKINKNSIFEIVSITKILTSNLIAQAIFENKIKPDAFIEDYLPEGYNLQINLREKIKITDLTSHQSGLPDLDFGKLIALNPQQPVSSVTMDTLTEIINNCNSLIDYGQYRYSTIGYIMLGQILENVYGKSYDEIIKEKILDPLQMTNTLTKEFNVKNKTTGYNPNGEIQEFFNWNITAPAGLVKSNASDMITFLKAILNKDNPISKAAILTEQIFYTDKNRKMGMGLNIITDDKNTFFLKSGDSLGQSSFICYNRIENWGIIIFINQRNSKMRENLLNEIYEKILK